MADRKLRAGSPCRVQNLDRYSLAVADEVGRLIGALGGIGWTLWDVAAAVDCSRTSLISWRRGAADMPDKKLLRLRDVVAENTGRRAA